MEIEQVRRRKIPNAIVTETSRLKSKIGTVPIFSSVRAAVLKRPVAIAASSKVKSPRLQRTFTLQLKIFARYKSNSNWDLEFLFGGLACNLLAELLPKETKNYAFV